MSSFTIVDWIVMIMMLVAIIVICYRSGRKNNTQDDYLLGGKSLDSGMVGLSLFATLVSTLSYLSYTGEMIKNGPFYLAGSLSYPFAAWIVGKYIIPRILKYKVTSGYEILEQSLGKGSRTLGVIYFISLRFMWMCTIIFATVRVALIPILGLSPAWTPVLCAAIILFTVFFTTIGGLRAVVATDAMQSIIMFLGAILTIVVILLKIDDFSVLSSPAMYSDWGRLEWLPRMDVRLTLANFFVMRLCWQICTAGSDQMAIQRYLSVKDSHAARRSFNVSLISSAAIEILLAIVGLFIMAYFTINSNLLPQGETISSAADSLFPLFIRMGLPAGITGLIAAALLAAAISSLSSGLNSVSSVIQEDILKKMRCFEGREFTVKSIKLISIFLGVAVLGCSFLVGYVQGNLFDVLIKVVNLVTAPLFVLFFHAMFSKKATDHGAVAGGLASMAMAVAVAFFGIFGISQMWILFTSLCVGILVGWMASWVDRQINKSFSV